MNIHETLSRIHINAKPEGLQLKYIDHLHNVIDHTFHLEVLLLTRKPSLVT